jgi:hypothetical protein
MRRKFHAHPDPNFGARARPRLQVIYDPPRRELPRIPVRYVVAGLVWVAAVLVLAHLYS